MDQVFFMLLLSFFLISILYSSVGHAGASGYLAIMAIIGVAPETMRPTALALNILVSSVVTFKFAKAGLIKWKTLYPLIITSIPLAFLGGTIFLPTNIYKPVLGIVLLFASFKLFQTANKNKVAVDFLKNISTPLSLLIGSVLGLLSGLTGTGGGIFLTPLLLISGIAGARTAGGLSAAFILVNSISGLLGNFTSVQNLPDNLVFFLLVVAIGGFIGAGLGIKKLGHPALKILLGIVLIIAGFKLIFL
jgi:uncharacterized membrane protein YfcA